MEELILYAKYVWGVFVTVCSIWLLIGRKYREIVKLWFAANEAKLSLDEQYEKIQEAKLEKILNRNAELEEINQRMEEVNQAKQLIVDEHIAQNKVLKAELRENNKHLEKYKQFNEEIEEQLNDAQSLIRRLRVYIKKLERVLREKNIDFEKINID